MKLTKKKIIVGVLALLATAGSIGAYYLWNNENHIIAQILDKDAEKAFSQVQDSYLS